MAKVEIGLRAVIGDINLTMLKRRHRAGIHIEIGIELAQTNFIAACLKQRAEGGGGNRRQTSSGTGCIFFSSPGGR